MSDAGVKVKRTRAREISSKERAFCDAILQGTAKTLSESYRLHILDGEVLDPNNRKRQKLIGSYSSRMWSSPVCVAYQDVCKKEIESHRARRMAGVRTRVTERLWMESEDMTSPAAARVSALKLLGTEAGMFRETKVHEHHAGHAELTEGELRAELETLLQSVGPALPEEAGEQDITTLVDSLTEEATDGGAETEPEESGASVT
tara:strand:+ start:3034 stop:3645 length:612 start_codon:yes stop_codon:yes gene_type:complete